MESLPLLKEFSLDLHPEYGVVIGLYSGVTNSKELRGMLRGGEYHAALLKANLVSDTLPVLVACSKAVDQLKKNSLKTRNIHTEIMYNLSPTTSINESLNKFGITDNDSEVLVVILSLRSPDFEKDAMNVNLRIKGSPKPLNDISIYSSSQLLIKIYKIAPEELSVGSVTDAVVCRVAGKEAC